MREKIAVTRAKQAAKTFGQECYIVRDYNPDNPLDSFELSFECSLDNYYATCPIIAIAYPNGDVD